ncbi:MAG: hypothetical protein M3Z26_02355 [Bacteroidota bacterium]|nr:hypothetical protein [Bacteroidota bacterium]
MKKVLLALLAITLSFGVFAQDSASSMSHSQNRNSRRHDGIMMRNGKLMVWENGQGSQLTQDRTLSNGTIISSNGTVKMSDGTTKTLKDGDYIGMDGTMGTMGNGNGKWKSKEKMDEGKMKSKMSDHSTDSQK